VKIYLTLQIQEENTESEGKININIKSDIENNIEVFLVKVIKIGNIIIEGGLLSHHIEDFQIFKIFK